MPTQAAAKRTQLRRSHWTLELAGSFEEAERQTRSYWRQASPAERLNALEDLRKPFYGPDQTCRRLQRFLELVPLPWKANKLVSGRPKDLQDLEELP